MKTNVKMERESVCWDTEKERVSINFVFFLSLFLFVCLPLCLSVCVSFFPTIHPSVSMPVCLFLCLPASMSVCLNAWWDKTDGKAADLGVGSLGSNPGGGWFFQLINIYRKTLHMHVPPCLLALHDFQPLFNSPEKHALKYVIQGLIRLLLIICVIFI